MSQNSSLPVPIPDSDSEPYWDGLREGILRYQRCQNCEHAQLYFRAMCRRCWSRRLETASSLGRGSVYSFTVVHQTGNAALSRELPFVLALVDLDEGPRVLSRIEADSGRVAIGDRVTATFHDIDGFRLLYFRKDTER